jgi:hypothetical protein
MWLGTLLGLAGFLLTLAGIAIVGRQAAPRLAPEVGADVAGAARAVLPAIPDGPEWRVASRIGTPWGVVARLRPYVEGFEVRGADCVLQLPRDGGAGFLPGDTRGSRKSGEETGRSEGIFERNPETVDWRRLASVLQAASPRLSAATKCRVWLADAESVEVRFAGPAAGAPVKESPGGVPRTGSADGAQPAGSPHAIPFVELRAGADPPFVLGVEATISGPRGSVARALLGMPWSGAPVDDGGPVDLRLTMDAVTLAVLSVRDLRFQDGLNGSALVFDPNPVVTSGRRELRDGNDVDAYRRWVSVPRLDGGGYLHGALVETITDRPPAAQEPDLSFAYSSGDPRFDETMAYVHGDRALGRADSLGFTGLFPHPLRMRLHATEADNSWYSRPTREVVLGDGGVDDAEDADIIIHESAHALHDALVPGFGDGDTRAIGEGFADFWAASLTGDPCIGDWDATSYSPPCLRSADEPAIWPAWLNGRPHHDGAIWSGLLWDLRGRLGRVDAERLALAALLEQGTAASWTEAADGLLRAAGRLGLGSRAAEIRTALADRGLIPRQVAFDLAPGESRQIGLLAPGRFLGGPVEAIQVCGDGRIVFEGSGGLGEALPFPGGPPTVIPCGVDGSADQAALAASSAGLRLSVDATVEGANAQVRLAWTREGAEVARLHADWNGTTGSLEWEYEDARPGIAPLPFFAAASAGGVAPDSVPELRPESIPVGGLGGLRGFRLPMDAGNDGLFHLVGTRFRIEEDAESGGFRLRRTAAAVRPTGSALVLVAQPNPFGSSVEIRLLRDAPTSARVAVFDILGRRVRSLGTTASEWGVVSFRWDGRDETGRTLPAGIYWARAEGNGERATVRLALLR